MFRTLPLTSATAEMHSRKSRRGMSRHVIQLDFFGWESCHEKMGVPELGEDSGTVGFLPELQALCSRGTRRKTALVRVKNRKERFPEKMTSRPFFQI